MADWVDNVRTEFLDELLWHEGLGSTTSPGLCYGCGIDLGVYRCLECMGGSLYCQACLLDNHAGLPLHRIEVSFGRGHLHLSR